MGTDWYKEAPLGNGLSSAQGQRPPQQANGKGLQSQWGWVAQNQLHLECVLMHTCTSLLAGPSHEVTLHPKLLWPTGCQDLGQPHGGLLQHGNT